MSQNQEQPKQFNFLLEAIKYRTNCPNCDYILRNPHEREHSGAASEYEELSHIPIILFEVSISLLNDKTAITPEHLLNFVSTHYRLMNFRCSNCSCYEYTIEMTIEKNKITNIILHSEEISISDGLYVSCWIKNYYESNRTVYKKYNDADCLVKDSPLYRILKPIIFPFLIKLDIFNPQKTIEVIKNLLPFI